MKSFLRIGFAAVAFGLALGACQGSFGSGGTAAPGGMGPPVNGPAPGQMNPSPAADMTVSPLPSGAPGEAATYPFTQANKGLKCPDQAGYSCTLYFNMTDAELAALDATPSPSPGKHAKKATPTPSPTPTPTPTPDASSSPSASPSASPTPSSAQMTIAFSATPQDAPAMANPDPKGPPAVPLVALRLTTTDDVIFQGNASARFTLPEDQISDGRGFAIQLFRETINKKNKKRSDNFAGSYKQSKLSKQTLTFTFNAPKLAVKKGETWLVVLYGDRLASPSPGPNASELPAGNPAMPGENPAVPGAEASPDAVPGAAATSVPSTTP